MFTQFITDRLSKPRNDPEVLLFDEYVIIVDGGGEETYILANDPFFFFLKIYQTQIESIQAKVCQGRNTLSQR